MVLLEKWECKEGSTWKKKGLFTEGNFYWGRNCKRGDKYVMVDDRGDEKVVERGEGFKKDKQVVVRHWRDSTLMTS